MTVRDAMIIGIVTIIGSTFMLCYFSGFDPTVVKVSAAVAVVILAIFFFFAYKRGVIKPPNKK